MKPESKNREAAKPTDKMMNRDEWITRAVAAATIGAGKSNKPDPGKTESNKD